MNQKEKGHTTHFTNLKPEHNFMTCFFFYVPYNVFEKYLTESSLRKVFHIVGLNFHNELREAIYCSYNPQHLYFALHYVLDY